MISIMLYITSMFMKTTHFQQANLMKKFPGLPCQRYMMVDWEQLVHMTHIEGVCHRADEKTNYGRSSQGT